MTPLFDYTFIDNHAAKTLVLLHGTGGNKSDFLFLDSLLKHSFNLLALQGNINENGLPRFFKRFAIGVFDEVNIKAETEKLHEFMISWQKAHDQAPEAYVYLGYSNGANMILATLFYFPALITTAVLLHPMLPFIPATISLKDKQFFISHGQLDAMINKPQQQAVIKLLKEKGGDVTQKNYAGGHEVSKQEIQDVLAFLDKTEN